MTKNGIGGALAAGTIDSQWMGKADRMAIAKLMSEL
jgi:hypothetical protein